MHAPQVKKTLTRRLLGGKLKLHVRDRLGRVKALGARPRAVEDGVAPVHAQLVLHLLHPLCLVGILSSAYRKQWPTNTKSKHIERDTYS